MRIIAGEARGRILKSPDGKGTRPTDARSREMLFNILGERIVDANFLDLYAGSGAVGLEALSRGARHCIFIEASNPVVDIKANLRLLEWEARAQVWRSLVKPAITRLKAASQRFDIIFADPPFTAPRELGDLCKWMDKAPELLHNVGGQVAGVLILQHHRKAQPSLNPPWRCLQQRPAGESVLSFFEVAPLPGDNDEDNSS